MNRDKRLWKMICLITALSVFFVVMTEARLSRFSIPLVGRENVHVLTEGTHVPDLAFFWDINRKVIRYNRDLLDTQKARIKEEFWKLFIHVVAVQEDALRKDPGIPDEKDAALQRASFASAQGVGQIFAGYLRTIDDILTPEQHSRHHKHHAGAKRPGRLHVVADLRTHVITSSMPTETQFARSHSHASEETTDVTRQFAWAAFAQVSLQTPLHHDLSQFQILRL